MRRRLIIVSLFVLFVIGGSLWIHQSNNGSSLALSKARTHHSTSSRTSLKTYGLGVTTTSSLLSPPPPVTSSPVSTTTTPITVPVTTTTSASVPLPTPAVGGVTATEYAEWTRVAVCEEGGWIGSSGSAYPDSLGISSANWFGNGGSSDVSPTAQILVAKRIAAEYVRPGWVPDQGYCASW